MLGFAGCNIDALDVDGVDQWDTLVNGGSTCASKTTQRFINKIIYTPNKLDWELLFSCLVHVIWTARRISKLVLNLKYL